LGGDAVETAPTGKVNVAARIENVYDLHEVSLGARAPDAVRAVDVPDALADTGAGTLSLPRRLVAALGLKPLRTRTARTCAGPITLQVYGTVRLTVQGRDCTCDVAEIPDDCPVLIGQIPLELLDFVVDPSGQRLIGNPAHGGEHVIELYCGPASPPAVHLAVCAACSPCTAFFGAAASFCASRSCSRLWRFSRSVRRLPPRL
jgi:predicted aspartyl protease